jgi:hypothetical protein
MAENYNYDMQRLQQDAIRRAREMQSRAQVNTAPVNRPVPKAPVPAQAAQPQNRSAPKPTAPAKQASVPVQQTQQQHEQHAPSEHEPPKGLNPINDIFEMLLSDSERTLILALILLLVEEKADTSLIFALMYLAM